MIGDNIKLLRKKKGLSLTELATKANIAKSNLSNIERNINDNPSIKVLIKIADELDVELINLLGISASQCMDQANNDEWTCFAKRLKEHGISTEKFLEYEKVIEFIEWQMKNSPIENINKR
ncbi:helix-turn-helix domain-containing protein [Salipaludibacillus daqingensis]|uniref:helix-turn-helix domain-containing protein n=1 Tax=Salipaludibacillus daqingensis TaxID=3041001 RepID=UPI002476E7F3|nr:helix-turn-helix transcriptional regulator [Salipaludibacillus daqingensis]